MTKEFRPASHNTISWVVSTRMVSDIKKRIEQREQDIVEIQKEIEELTATLNVAKGYTHEEHGKTLEDAVTRQYGQLYYCMTTNEEEDDRSQDR